MLISVCKKLIRGQKLCTVWGSLLHALHEAMKIRRQGRAYVQGPYKYKIKAILKWYGLLPNSSTKLKARNDSNRHTHPPGLQHSPEGLRRIGIPGCRTKQLFLQRITPWRFTWHLLDLRKTFFPFKVGDVETLLCNVSEEVSQTLLRLSHLSLKN